MDCAPHRADQFVFEVEDIGDVNAQTIGNAGHCVSHSGEIFAEGHHVGAIVGPAQEEAAVGDDEQGTIGLAIPHRLVEVEIEFGVDAIDIEVSTVHMALGDGDIVIG